MLSMKNPILADLKFCRPFFKTQSEEAWTIWSGRLFHRLTTLFEKNYFLMSFEQLCLEIFKEWPLVRPICFENKERFEWNCS